MIITKDAIYTCFVRLKHMGLPLGMQELMDAILLADLKPEWDDLEPLLLLLWCDSTAEYLRFNEAWDSILLQLEQQEEPPAETQSEPVDMTPTAPLPSKPIDIPAQKPVAKPVDTPAQKPAETTSTKPQFSAMPIRAPQRPLEGLNQIELAQYYPISRRFMQYSWKYLRRDVADGPRDVLDFDATVHKAVQQGFFFEAIYQRRVNNYAHLVLLLDHGGSMTPFHHYIRELVITASEDSSIANVDVYYFNNVPTGTLYTNPKRTKQVNLTDVFETLDDFSSVLIISDAGAARKNNNFDRLMETDFFLDDLFTHTGQVAWLNPMPESRWHGSSAEEISKSRPNLMFPMNEDGMSNALDVLRGIVGD